jgi:hypothetical protein
VLRWNSPTAARLFWSRFAVTLDADPAARQKLLGSTHLIRLAPIQFVESGAVSRQIGLALSKLRLLPHELIKPPLRCLHCIRHLGLCRCRARNAASGQEAGQSWMARRHFQCSSSDWRSHSPGHGESRPTANHDTHGLRYRIAAPEPRHLFNRQFALSA